MIPEMKRQFQQHFDETQRQKARLKQIITSHGGDSTDAKADLPILKPNTIDLVRDDITSSPSASNSPQSSDSSKSSSGSNPLVESIVKETDNIRLAAEKQLIETEHDAIIEQAEIVKYKILLEVAKIAGATDAIPVIRQNLKEEENMADWIFANIPSMLQQLWAQIEVSAGARTTTET
jgi:ferritin-like metal-binding protein YciE